MRAASRTAILAQHDCVPPSRPPALAQRVHTSEPHGVTAAACLILLHNCDAHHTCRWQAACWAADGPSSPPEGER
jgi:hypothetical protein